MGNRYTIGNFTVRFYSQMESAASMAKLMSSRGFGEYEAVKAQDYGWLIKAMTQVSVYYDVDGRVPEASVFQLFPFLQAR